MTHPTPMAARVSRAHTQQRGHTADLSPFDLHAARRSSVSERGSVGASRAPLMERAYLPRPAGATGGVSAGTARHATLGSALAGTMWAWAPPARVPAHHRTREQEHVSPAASPVIQSGGRHSEAEAKARTPVELSMPSALLRAMAAAAASAGRRECDVWAEAAREWLLRHSQDDDPPPPPAAAAPDPTAPRSARERCWTAIDVLLNDLRGPTRPHPAAPAAVVPASVASVARYPASPAA